MVESARLNSRITPDVRAHLERGAETHIVRLSLQDQYAFVDAILQPPDPTPALYRAFRRHRELIQPTD
jgi:uncharacterized protein (DUF1778 family)